MKTFGITQESKTQVMTIAKESTVTTVCNLFHPSHKKSAFRTSYLIIICIRVCTT